MISEHIKAAGIVHNSHLIGSAVILLWLTLGVTARFILNVNQPKGLIIKHIFEIHRNEDYIIDSIALNSLTDTKIYHGPGLN